MKPQAILILLLLVATTSWAADTAPADNKPANKTGDSVKSTYHKTVATLKKHGKRAPCTKAAKSMGQCHTT